VLVHSAGMGEPGLRVATSRHRDKVTLFAGRDQLETPADAPRAGHPRHREQLGRRVVAALAEQARNPAWHRQRSAPSRPSAGSRATAPASSAAPTDSRAVHLGDCAGAGPAPARGGCWERTSTVRMGWVAL